MSIRFSPAIKGIITGTLMIAVVAGAYYSNQSSDRKLQYIIYAMYGLGIIWTLVAFRQSSFFTGKFAELFGQGFRCFIVVTLIMVTFTFVFNRMHPEFREESTNAYREHRLKEKDKLSTDIENDVARYKKSYNTIVLYGAIFGYLIIGAGVTAVLSALLTRRK